MIPPRIVETPSGKVPNGAINMIVDEGLTEHIDRARPIFDISGLADAVANQWG